MASSTGKSNPKSNYKKSYPMKKGGKAKGKKGGNPMLNGLKGPAGGAKAGLPHNDSIRGTKGGYDEMGAASKAAKSGPDVCPPPSSRAKGEDITL